MRIPSIAFRTCSVLLILSWAGAPVSAAFAARQETSTAVWLNLDGVDLREVLKVLGKDFDVDFAFDERIPQAWPITLTTTARSPAESVDAIAGSTGLETVRDGAALLVTRKGLSPTSASPGSGFPRLDGAKPVNLDLKLVKLETLLSFLEKSNGAHVVLDASVSRQIYVTCWFRSKPWPEALDKILRVNDLTSVRDGDSYRIVSAERPSAVRPTKVAWIVPRSSEPREEAEPRSYQSPRDDAPKDASPRKEMPPVPFAERDDLYREVAQAAHKAGRAPYSRTLVFLVSELAVTGVVATAHETGVFLQASPTGESLFAVPGSATFGNGTLERVETGRNGGVPYAIFKTVRSFSVGGRIDVESSETTKVLTRATALQVP